jgi:hypothetical protein
LPSANFIERMSNFSAVENVTDAEGLDRHTVSVPGTTRTWADAAPESSIAGHNMTNSFFI